MAKPLITVIGSLNTDLITRTSRIPSAGETLTSQSFDTGCGGKGANQAVACARLSRCQGQKAESNVDVAMVGAVGDDVFGQELIDGLEANGIDVGPVIKQKGEKSGVAVIIVEEDTGENRILISPNANYSLSPDRFTSLPGSKPDLIVLQLEIPLETVLQIIRVAREQDVAVLLNPAPAVKLPAEAFRGVTHLILNESEAAILACIDIDSISEEHLSTVSQDFLDLGVQHVVITLGGAGVVYYSAATPGKGHRIEAEKVNVVDTTAAGDTFVGAYAAALARIGKHGTSDQMLKAITWANRAAGRSVEKKGAQAAIPWLDEVPFPESGA